MALRALPEGYVDFSRGRIRLVSRQEHAEALVAAGALDGVPLERLGAAGAPITGGRRALLRLDVPGVAPTLVVKALRRGGLLRGVLPSWRRTGRAFEEILLTESLRQAGAPVLPVLGARLEFPPVLRGVARIHVWSALAPGAWDLAAALSAGNGRGGTDSPSAIRRAVEAAGRAIAGVHAAGVAHEDLNARNVLVLADGTARLIDFGDGAARATPARCAANLARLWRSARKLGVARRMHAARLVRAYAKARSGEDWREWWRRAAAAYRRTAWLHAAPR